MINAEKGATPGFNHERVQAFSPNTIIIKATCTRCGGWLTANSSHELSEKEATHAASCTKIRPL